jgi:hypothetical protein
MSETELAPDEELQPDAAEGQDAPEDNNELANATDEETSQEQEPDEVSKLKDALRERDVELRKMKRALKEKDAEVSKATSGQFTQDEATARQIDQRAKEVADVNAYNDRANEIYKAGKGSFKDFDGDLAQFKEAGLPLSREFVEAADHVGDAHKLIHHLAQNIDEAERIMSLPPHKIGVALAKIKIEEPKAPVKVSKAPEPIKPINGKAKAELRDEDMPIAEYMKREDERWANRRR